MSSIVDQWNAAYFNNALSPAALSALAGLEAAKPDAQALADRAFRLMRMARIEPADLSVFTAWVIGFGAPRTVPSAWGWHGPAGEDRGSLVPREFAFSIDNVRPLELAPWYALHDDDLENLANATAVATLRTDKQFQRRFDDRLDALLAQRDFCARGADVYLSGPDDNMSVDECTERCAGLAAQLEHEGFVDEAIVVFRNAGQEAWRNAAGHVAIRPVEPPRLPASKVI